MIEFELTDEQERLIDQMTDLQHAVVSAIVSGRPPVAAYLQAGGQAENPQASIRAIRKLPHIATFIKSVRHMRIKESIMTREEALQKLTSISRAKLSEMVEFETFQVQDAFGNMHDQSTWRFKDSDELPANALDAIMELTAGPRGLKLKLHDQKQAIKQIGELEGWEAPKKIEVEVETESKLAVDQLSMETLLELWAAKPDLKPE